MSHCLDMNTSLIYTIFVLLTLHTCRILGMSPYDDRLIVQCDSTLSPDVDQLYNYCNHPGAVRGKEGQPEPGYSLQQVHLVLTPGLTDVSSKVTIQGHTFPTMSCDLSNRNKTLNKVTSFQQDANAYKQMNHNPHFSHFHPTFPTYCSNNHLTAYGFQQLCSVGDHLKMSYLDHRTHKKFTGHYSTIHVSSTPTQTSYHSLLAFMHGFLGEKQLYKTKIHESRGDFCEFGELNLSTCNCVKIRELSPFAYQSSARGSFLFKDSFPNKDKIMKLLQVDNITKATGVELFQLLMQYKCNKESRPGCRNRLCRRMDESKLTELHKALVESLSLLYAESNFRKHSQLRVYPFLEQLMIHTEKLDSQRAVNVYMGDKHFLQYLITALDLLMQQVMSIASRLVIEVFKKNWGQLDGGELYLRVLYNGADVTHQLAVCSHSLENGLCKMDRFKHLITQLRHQYTENCPNKLE